jgi:hypothetical protein
VEELIMQRRPTTVILALAVSLWASSAVARAQTTTAKQPAKAKAAAVANVPAEFQAAISQMRTAQGSLQKAGDKWCGHRIKAISLIDQTLRARGQPSAPGQREMDSGPKDEPTELQDGITALESAKSDFEKSDNEWNGRRDKATSLISEALNELQLGMECAKSQGTY